ncbi:hypothetical protein C8A00DRAFT_34714 [Chaetomidium leptoderma]|uniref:Transmembrane protein 53 n=1 Tax=Chaetomidium leptoderma TaxID=669021 RepID=A0AAN6VKN1_9PEZI|nr:hypothetical protein C8A00DRAFT_34714 [Chaetomidium leptoderma]
MASNAATTRAASPLAAMTKLSPSVYFYRPTTPSPATADTETISSQNPAPKLIILATWMGARDPHIAKYLVQYQALYPTAPVLLLRSEPRHFISPRGNPREFAPATPVVCSIFPDLGTTPMTPANKAPNPQQQAPQLLIHAWSNGGAASLHHLRRALARPAAATAPPLPPYTIVLDSTPGLFRYRAGYRAFSAGLTGLAKWLAAPFLHALCAWYWLAHGLVGRGRTGPLAAAAAALNDGAARRSEVRRTYVYGPGDRLVHWRDVEAHAAEADKRGFRRARRERFEGSEHVAHVRVDAGRYWRVAKETWEGVD